MSVTLSGAKSIQISNLNGEMATDNSEGIQKASEKMAKTSNTYTNSQKSSLSSTTFAFDNTNPDILSDSNIDGQKLFLLQHEKDEFISEERAANINHSSIPNSCRMDMEMNASKIEEIKLENDMLENRKCKNCGNERPKIKTTRTFSYTELHTATNGFSTKNFLSEGGFGSVYKGELEDGQWVAVKQHKHASLQGEKEFKAEVQVLSKARHENVVMLLGSCSEGSHRLLVYEYVCNGSLDIHLSRNSSDCLSWTERMKITLGTARGLNYLHQNNIIHRDMGPNNILLTHEYDPLLGDFGLARTQENEFDKPSENKVVGTFGYLAPEYAERGRVSTKTDVYSFGVVLLELITGQTIKDRNFQEPSLVEWAIPLLKEGKYPELIDERILESHDVHQLFWIVSVAETCLRRNPDKRPSMEMVEYKLRKYIMDRVTVCGIEDFSPTYSSFSSLSPSNGSSGHGESETKETANATSQSMNGTQKTEAHPLTFLAPTSRTQNLRGFEGSASGIRKDFQNRKGKLRSTQISYNEMLD
ncbi:probable serine/threonine-protein kinase PBL23 [Typha latifolia]|uniref:probable serine/threonine-protein kinase PBL23 n=1 Tax=Typha latifolia TaxID=4733 RepID=UPI003C2F9344